MKTENIKNKLNCENFDMKELSIKKLKHLKNQVKSLTDKRIKRKCKYKIWDIVCVALLAVISNYNEWEEIEMFGIMFFVSLGAEEEIHNIFYLLHKKKLSF